MDELKSKAAQVFDPGFFGIYSFEYAYRLFLVFLSLNKGKIKEVRVGDPHAFDKAFIEDFKSAISYALSYHDVMESEALGDALLTTCNDAAIGFIKSPMNQSVGKAAKDVAKAMDGIVASSWKQQYKTASPKVFSEVRE